MKHVLRAPLPGYGVAGVSTALATLAQFPLRPWVGSQHPYSFFYVAVMVTAWYGGLRRALLALTLGAVSAVYFFLPPANTLAISGAANQIGFVLYLFVALFGTLLIEALRQQQRPAEDPVWSWGALRAGENESRRTAEATERRLIEARQEALALAGQLKTAREELARADERIRCQQDELQQLVELMQRRSEREAPSAAVELLPRLPIRSRDSVLLLRVAEIDYVECRDRQGYVWTRGDEYATGFSFRELEALLPAGLFYWINDSCLVNLDRIRDLVFPGGESHEVRLLDGQRLPVARGRYAELRRHLGLDDNVPL